MIGSVRKLVKATPSMWIFEFPSGDVVVECRRCGWSMLIDSSKKKDAVWHFRSHWVRFHLNGYTGDDK